MSRTLLKLIKFNGTVFIIYLSGSIEEDGVHIVACAPRVFGIDNECLGRRVDAMPVCEHLRF